MVGEGAKHPDNKPNMQSPPEGEEHEQFGSGFSIREVKRAVPSLVNQKDQEVGVNQGVATTDMKSAVSNQGVRKV